MPTIRVVLVPTGDIDLMALQGDHEFTAEEAGHNSREHFIHQAICGINSGITGSTVDTWRSLWADSPKSFQVICFDRSDNVYGHRVRVRVSLDKLRSFGNPFAT